jgi:hypothetical protein
MQSDAPKPGPAILYDGHWHAIDRRGAKRTRCQIFVPQDEWDKLPHEDREPDCPLCTRSAWGTR